MTSTARMLVQCSVLIMEEPHRLYCATSGYMLMGWGVCFEESSSVSFPFSFSFSCFLSISIKEDWIFFLLCLFSFVCFLGMVINIARGWSFSLEFSLLFAFIFVSVNNDSFPLSPLYCLSSVCNEMTINIARRW